VVTLLFKALTFGHENFNFNFFSLLTCHKFKSKVIFKQVLAPKKNGNKLKVALGFMQL
jgi:hypothetical protein